MWSCCGANGIWSQVCDDCDDPNGHERDQTDVLDTDVALDVPRGLAPIGTERPRDGFQLGTMPRLPGTDGPPMDVSLRDHAPNGTERPRDGFQFGAMPRLPGTDGPPPPYDSPKQSDRTPEQLLANLGASPLQARVALERSHGDINKAGDYYLNNERRPEAFWSPGSGGTHSVRELEPEPEPEALPEAGY